MKSKLLEKKKYPAACEYCKHGRLSPDEKSVLCIKKGIVEKITSDNRVAVEMGAVNELLEEIGRNSSNLQEFPITLL